MRHEAISCLPVVLFIDRATERIIFHNRYFAEVFGHDHQRLSDPQFDLKALVDAGDRELFRAQIKNAASSTTDKGVRYRIHLKNGDAAWCMVHCSAVEGAEGEPAEMVCVTMIAELAAEAEVATEREWNELREKLNSSKKQLDEFAYVASHDMQEPLRKITTFSDKLNEKYRDVLQGDGAMYLDRLTTAARNMRTLINHLLEFSRVSNNTLPFAATSLNFVMRQVLHELNPIITSSHATITTSDLPTITGSVTQLTQLFQEIISNAIKFSRELPAISVTCAEASANEAARHLSDVSRKYFKIVFIDNGIGFDNQYADRIFQLFQRLNGKSEFPGSGIGLAICKKIVERHGGAIYASGMPEHGSEFTILLPIPQSDRKNELHL